EIQLFSATLKRCSPLLKQGAPTRSCLVFPLGIDFGCLGGLRLELGCSSTHGSRFRPFLCFTKLRPRSSREKNRNYFRDGVNLPASARRQNQLLPGSGGA